jgi:hypothetical protein
MSSVLDHSPFDLMLLLSFAVTTVVYVQVLAVCREGGVTQIIADQPQFHLLIGHAGTCAMPKPVGGRLLKAAGPLFIWSPLARRRSAVPPKTSFTLLWSAARVKGARSRRLRAGQTDHARAGTASRQNREAPDRLISAGLVQVSGTYCLFERLPVSFPPNSGFHSMLERRPSLVFSVRDEVGEFTLHG